MFKRIKKLLDFINSVEDPIIKEALEKKKIQDEKKVAYNQLVKSPFKYEIIKDFVEAASLGVVVRFTVDGIPIEIRKELPDNQDRFKSSTF